MSGDRREIVPGGVYRIPYPCENTYECFPIELHIHPGTYRFELWGAGMTSGGGYVSGEIHFFSMQTLYCFIGGVAPSGPLSGVGGYNGGGTSNTAGTQGGSGDGYRQRGGDGATDIRLNADDLYSRIMVSGGAGGGNHMLAGGCGGGLVGGNGSTTASSSFIIGQGGSQVEGGLGQYEGQFGVGGTCTAAAGTDLCGCGGGGLFGGGSGYHNDFLASGGGGSSYISGYHGCINHSSGIIFYDPIMISGDDLMPSPGGELKFGPFGSGYVQINSIDPIATFNCVRNSFLVYAFIYSTFLSI